MYNNLQNFKFSKKFGGYRVVFTGINKTLTSGRYTCPSTDLPDVSLGYLPAGTPALFDDEERTVAFHHAFRVSAAATASATKIKLEKGFEGSRVKVGMVLMVAPTAIDGTGKAVAVTAVNTADSTFDEITVATLGVALAVGDVLVEASAVGDTSTIKVKPNALLPYDLPRDPNSTIVQPDGMFNLLDGTVLENRIPPIADAVKAYMQTQGCYFRFSKSKE